MKQAKLYLSDIIFIGWVIVMVGALNEGIIPVSAFMFEVFIVALMINLAGASFYKRIYLGFILLPLKTFGNAIGGDRGQISRTIEGKSVQLISILLLLLLLFFGIVILFSNKNILFGNFAIPTIIIAGVILSYFIYTSSKR